MRREKVYIVSRCVDSKWADDDYPELVKVFKGSRRLPTIARYVAEQKRLNPRYIYWVEIHEVE